MRNYIRPLLVLLCFLFVTALTSSAQPRFTWRVQDRFGTKDKEGLTDYRWDRVHGVYEADYVNPTHWIVDFDGCNPLPPTGTRFVWEIDGQALAESQCRFSHSFTTQGLHAVRLTVTTPDGQTASFDETVTIKDLFIVSIGDSYASGEGNPDKPWKVVKKARWIDSRCHRSATAGPALAALAVEKDDPHTSVTFISFACSGSGLQDGLTGEFKKLPPQLEQVVATAKGRPIDALLISSGGNDLNFSTLVRRAIQLRHAETDRVTAHMVTTGLAELAKRYEEVARRLSTMTVAKVFITEYPVIVRDEKRTPCDHSPKFPDLLNGISKAESEWAERDVIKPLNDKVKEAATLWGWVYVTGISSKFSGADPETIAHGYCANGERWVRTFNDSWHIQGNHLGTAHPNGFGHAWYATQLVLALRDNGVVSGVTPPQSLLAFISEFLMEKTN
jgi:hypothetical protein